MGVAGEFRKSKVFKSLLFLTDLNELIHEGKLLQDTSPVSFEELSLYQPD